jgi:hypothetical protein
MATTVRSCRAGGPCQYLREPAASPGDTIYTPAGEWHWHGAAPGHFMTHLAMWESPGEGQGPETEWGALVTDAEYHARPD